ncbi:MAG: YitT family protein [bacterium]
MKLRMSRDIILISAGILITSASYAFFIVPAKLIPGGISGISIILHHLFQTPFGIVMLVINIPLLIAGIKVFGRMFGIRTVIATIAVSFVTDGFAYFFKPLVFDNNNLLLSSVYGGAFLGIGLGLIFKGRGSTGGSDVVGRIMNRYTSLSVGYSILLVDAVIIILSGFVFKNYELILYSFITLFLSSKAIDIILEGRDYARGVMIFTSKPEVIANAILEEMNRGVTGLMSRGMYTMKERTTLYCVVSRREIARLTDIVRSNDEDAFIVVENVYEVLGRGFRRR